jgi:hypothetical protein
MGLLCGPRDNSQYRLLLMRVGKLKLNSVACVRQRTKPTERPLLVSEVSAKFCG